MTNEREQYQESVQALSGSRVNESLACLAAR
jgi:hypothetical protein